MDDDDTLIDPDPAAVSAVRAKDSRAHRMFKLMALLALVGTLILAGATWWVAADSMQLRSTVSTVSGQQAYAATVAQQLASQLRQMGATPVVSPPSAVVGQPGATGAAGPSGEAGRGITSTVITGGHLIVAYSDGTTTDEGQVVGKDGVGIVSSVVNGSGHLILTYTSGAVDDVGAVVGPAGATGATGAAGNNGQDGCGIASVGESNGDLVVNYSGSTCSTSTATVGPLPAGPTGPTGPAGATGAAGPAPYSWSWTDELGVTHQCTENPDDPPHTSTPTYVCNPSN